MTDNQNPSDEQNGGANLNTPERLAEIAANEDASMQEMLELSPEQLMQLAMGEEVTLGDDPATPPKELTDAVEKLTGDENGQDPSQTPETPPAAPSGQPGNVPSIPKPRFDEVNNKLKATEETALELARKLGHAEAQLEAAKQQNTAAPAAPATPAVDPVQVLNHAIIRLNQQKEEKELKIAEEYDTGTMTEVEKVKAYKALEKEYAQAVTPLYNQRNQLIERSNAPDPEIVEQQIIDDPWLKSQTQELIKQHPWLETVNESLYNVLHDQAYNQLLAEGRNITQDVAGTWLLRQKIAEVGKSFGLSSDAATVAANTPKPLSPEAQNRQAKINLANNHPPSLGQVGSTHVSTSPIEIDEKTDPKRLAENMTDAQLTALTTGGY